MVRLTNKQKRPLKRGNVAAKLRQYKRQDKRNTMRKRTKSDQLVGIRQGVGAAPKRGYGSSGKSSLRAVDAFDLCHLPLPRAVGGKTGIRTTVVITSDDPLSIFGTMMVSDTVAQLQAREWSQLIAYSMPDAGQLITGTNAAAVLARQCLGLIGIDVSYGPNKMWEGKGSRVAKEKVLVADSGLLDLGNIAGVHHHLRCTDGYTHLGSVQAAVATAGRDIARR
ncbi:unnamed protein product, partial [Symbiodinium sp. KB8]